jgi:hypothetical protein
MTQSQAISKLSVGRSPGHLAAAVAVIPTVRCDQLDSSMRVFLPREPHGAGTLRNTAFPEGIPSPSTTTIHFVPLPARFFPTFQPLFPPEQNSHPEALGSS